MDLARALQVIGILVAAAGSPDDKAAWTVLQAKVAELQGQAGRLDRAEALATVRAAAQGDTSRLGRALGLLLAEVDGRPPQPGTRVGGP